MKAFSHLSTPCVLPQVANVRSKTPLIFSPLSLSPPLLPFSQVYGRAQVNRSAGVVRYLGRHPSVDDCIQACIRYKDPSDGAVCNSFSYHEMNFPSSDFKGACTPPSHRHFVNSRPLIGCRGTPYRNPRHPISVLSSR